MLYHAFHVQGYRLVNWEFDEHKVLMHVEPQNHKVCCSTRGHDQVVRHGGVFEPVIWLKSAELPPTPVKIRAPLIFHVYSTNYGGPVTRSCTT